MKKPVSLLILFLFGTLMLSQTACIEGDILNADVPKVVKETYNDTFAGATNPDWRQENHLYEVEFAWQGAHWFAVINCDGILEDSYSLGEADYQGRQPTNDTPRKPTRSN